MFAMNQNTIICEGTPPTFIPYVHFMSMEPRKYYTFFKKNYCFVKQKKWKNNCLWVKIKAYISQFKTHKISIKKTLRKIKFQSKAFKKVSIFIIQRRNISWHTVLYRLNILNNFCFIYISQLWSYLSAHLNYYTFSM